MAVNPSMKITMIIVLGFLFISTAIAQDSAGYWKNTKDVPKRLYYDDGSLMTPQDIELVHDKDCCPDGWKFNCGEWESIYFFPIEPAYYDDPENGSNNGYSFA